MSRQHKSKQDCDWILRWWIHTVSLRPLVQIMEALTDCEEDECVLIEMKWMSSQAPVVFGQLHGLLELFLNTHTYGLYCNHYKHVDLLFKGSGKGKFICLLLQHGHKTSFRSRWFTTVTCHFSSWLPPIFWFIDTSPRGRHATKWTTTALQVFLSSM